MLRVLLVEDSEDDAELVLRELRRGGYAVSYLRVETASRMREALTRQAWDVILSDFLLPEFNVPEALAIREETGADVPLIIVSGAADEDVAAKSLRAGAQDFVPKDKLVRLVPAVEREVREQRAREELRRSSEALRTSDARLKARTQQLEQREAMFEALFETAPDAILLIDATGVIALANAEAERIFGYPRSNLPGQTVDTLFPVQERDNDVLLVFANPEGRRMGERQDLVARRLDGLEFPVNMSVGPFSLEGRTVALCIIRDMRAQRSVEAQLRQAQKMEAVGRLAAGVAHDFNNILSVILSYAQMIDDDATPGEALHGDAGEIRTAAMRAVDLTRQLLMFSRQHPVVARVVDLDYAVAGMASMLRRLLGAHIKLTVLAGSNEWRIKVNQGELEQVVMNLAVNARDAMANGGSLTIETKQVALDAEYAAAHHDVAPGPYVMLAVTDTGVGFDKETEAHIFEPFFTTKDATKGTGLGLATVFGIVKQAGGHILVYSEPGVGTTFRVYFPKSSGSVETRPSQRPPTPDPVPTTETILLVEDDDQLRAVASGILRKRGYVVLEASNGGEALLICEQHGAVIHLLLTDVVLPRMSGRQLAERLQSSRADLKVLFMSGYTDDAILQHGILDSDVDYLQKPFTPGSLTRQVRAVLSEERVDDGPS